VDNRIVMPDRTMRGARGAATVAALLLLAACGGTPSNPDPDSPANSIGTITTMEGMRLAIQVIARGLEIPWSMAFAPDGRLFVTERPGRVRIIAGGQLLSEPALTLPDVAAVGEGGLLGMALHPGFADNRLVYVVYMARHPALGLVNRLARFREAGNRLGEPAILLDGIQGEAIHDGGRLRFGPDGHLYMTMGDAARPAIAQDLASLNGKILRVTDTGSTPPDNPRASPIYSLGHRNPQGIDWHPATGDLWGTEHGETGNDEINRIEAGANYGWPVIQGGETLPGMQPPVLSFSPAVAPSGASFYTGSTIAAFRSDFFVATLRGGHLLRVRFDPADPRRVIGTERLLEGRFGRLRDVITGPDGALYFATSNRDGRAQQSAEDDRILRLVPAP
jgi:glucose/arabinose dehydrogenase